MELLTAARMRAVEQAAMDSGEVTGLELMTLAGRGVVEAIFEEWPELDEGGRRAVILCGPGNNGGDGFVIASLLLERGWSVDVFHFGDAAKLPPDAAETAREFAAASQILEWDEAAIRRALGRASLIVDAVFGIGISRPLPAAVASSLAAAAGAEDAKIVAVDCPSGLDCDTGRFTHPAAAPRNSISADLTVTFHRAKVGHHLADGPAACGKLACADIGLEQGTAQRSLAEPPAPSAPRLVDPTRSRSDPHGRQWARRMTGLSERAMHKYDRGHIVTLSGGVGKGGAARLAARASLRVGGGLATIYCPPEAMAEHAAQLNSVMLQPFESPASFRDALKDHRISSICIGPALGVGERTKELVSIACAAPEESEFDRRRVVIDADALTSFQDEPDALFALTHVNCVLTPHEGEFARLFPELSEKERAASGLSKLHAVREASKRAGCTVLLKGPDTVIASPGDFASIHASVYERTAPWLGTAGAGDVLAGLIAGLLAGARGEGRTHQAAEFAAWLHVEAARKFGPGLMAEDLPKMLPAVFRDLGL